MNNTESIFLEHTERALNVIDKIHEEHFSKKKTDKYEQKFSCWGCHRFEHGDDLLSHPQGLFCKECMKEEGVCGGCHKVWPSAALQARETFSDNNDYCPRCRDALDFGYQDCMSYERLFGDE